MKTRLFCHLIVSALALPLMAAEGLKVELLTPNEPILIQEARLKEAAESAEAVVAYQAEMNERKLDRESLMRLEKMAMAGQNAKQGIELTYRITNTSDEAITIQHGGDSTANVLEVTGPGAVNLPYNGMMTMEFRMGRSITIEPGKSEEFTIKELKYGKRDMSRWLITKAGDYQVVLTYVAKIGRKRVPLKSPVAKFTVKTP